MSYRSSTGALALATAMMVTSARAADEAKYPNWKGQWAQILTPGLEGQMVKFDPTKPWGRGQQAPLTPEYQKVHEDSMADQAKGGLDRQVSSRRHAAHDDRCTGICDHAGNHLYPNR